ncbi:MAG: hypothetical protein QXE52_08040 [Candidatus Caldarchaeum sp.]
MAKDDIIVAVTDEQLPTVDEALVGFFEWAQELYESGEDVLVVARLLGKGGNEIDRDWREARAVEVTKVDKRSVVDVGAIDVANSGSFEGRNYMRIGRVWASIPELLAGEAMDDTRWTGRLKIWFVEDCEPRVLELSIATIEKLVDK